jgi:hypothetical protein
MIEEGLSVTETTSEKAPERRMYTVRNFLRAYDLTHNQFYAEIKSGRLKTVLIGRRRYIPIASAREWERVLLSEAETRAA